MAIYEHGCPEHGTFEEERPMAQSSRKAKCPQCGKPAPRVMSSSIAVSYKGEGWSGGRSAAGDSHIIPTF